MIGILLCFKNTLINKNVGCKSSEYLKMFKEGKSLQIVVEVTQ